MNVLLISPPNPESMVIIDNILAPEPLALEYLGAGISDRHNVRIFDMRFEKIPFSDVVKEFNPDVIGFTSFTFHVNTVKKLCKESKEIKNDILTIVGGCHATLTPQDFNNPYVDIVVIGEGVFTFKDIVDTFEKKLCFSTVKGIAWQNNGLLNFTDPRGFSDLNTYPMPDRSLTDHIRDKYYKMALVVTSKGCPYHCNFCCCWKLSKRTYLTREPESILEELKVIEESIIHFADDESFIDIERMERLADLIIDSGIDKKFICYVRADTVVNHPELLKKWQKAGLTYAFIGVESHNDKYLKMYQKDNSTAINEKAIATIKELGIGLMASFIIRPEFDKEDFASLLEYIKELKPEVTFFSVLTPFPGTDLFSETKDQFITQNYDLFDMWHTILPTKLPLRQFFNEINTLYTQTIKNGGPLFNNLLGSASEQNPLDLQNFITVLRKVRNSYLHYEEVIK